LLDPESEAIAEAYEARPAVRRQLRGLLDVVQRAFSLEPQEQTAGDTALDVAGGFVPGVSQAMALRDIERARRAGDPAGMAMAATEFVPFGRLASAVGDIPGVSRIAEYDPRFDTRKKEQERLKALTPVVESRGTVNPPEVSISEFEGRPFIISQSDRTAAGGLLTGINDVKFSQPVNLRGGQDFMFENPEMVWASGKSPVSRLQKMAAIAKKETGQDPLLLPYRMTPSGGDFAAMTGEAMLNYADAVMPPIMKKEIDKKLKDIIPEWSGLGTEKGIKQYQQASQKKRNAVRKVLDKDYRERGGLSIGEARLSVTDPRQYTAADTGLQNVGVIYAGRPTITKSGHPSYPFGVPGEGVGLLKEDIQAYELLPELAAARQIADPRSPNARDYRALMVPRAGVITEEMLRKLGL
jgi:hypothetical protein